MPRDRTLSFNPVAWRVKDYGDGWILFSDETAANKLANETGALLQGLYVRTGCPVTPKRSELASVSGSLIK